MKYEKKILQRGLLIAIFLLALYAYNVHIPDLYFDEAIYHYQAREFVEEGTSLYDTAIWTPPLFNFTTSLSFVMMGISNFSSRFLTIIAGVIAVWITFLLARLYFNRTISTLAALLLGLSPIFVVYSRIALFDVMLTAFSLLAIYAVEKYQLKGKRQWLLYASIFFALAFLTKFNAIVVWFFYWVFKICHPLIKKEIKIFRENVQQFALINAISAILVFILVFITGGLGRVIAMAHNVVLQFTIQSTNLEFPRLYHFGAFVDWLSPVIYPLFILAIIVFAINYKKKEKGLYLMWFLTISQLLLFTYLPRKASRHFIPMIPFVMIVIAYHLYNSRHLLSSDPKMAKKVWTGAMIIILLGSLIFSLSQVGKINRHTYWTQTANFIESDYPNATIIITQHDYWFLAELRDSTYLTPHYLDTNFVIPDKDQLVVTTYTKEAYATQDHSPLDNDLTFFKRSKNTTSEAFITYLENNGHIVFTGHNGPDPAVVVYKITKTPKNSPGILKTAPPPESKSAILKVMWAVLCTAHEGNPLVVESIFPDNLAESVKNKCN